MKPRKGSNEIFHYITAFGVEKEWSKVFAGITIPTPNWYDGGAIQAFLAATLTTDIVAFSRALSASTTSKSSGTTVLQVEDFLAVSEVGEAVVHGNSRRRPA